MSYIKQNFPKYELKITCLTKNLNDVFTMHFPISTLIII